jgi:DNA-binding PadR family transcriptional regulator
MSRRNRKIRHLASHVDKLERAGYVAVEKSFSGKMPHTEYRLTDAGRTALAKYWIALDAIRADAQRPS